jgi:hypothetical protein
MHVLLKELKAHQNQYILTFLLVMYILLPISTPSLVANAVDNLLGRIVLIVVAISLLFHHPVLGAVALIASYELLYRSEKVTGSYQVRTFLPTEYNKGREINALNQFPSTLEEEMVKNMVPMKKKMLSNPAYKPVLGKIYDAAHL